MILSDKEIAELCQGDRPMIENYNPELIRKNPHTQESIFSHGQSSYSYDIVSSGLIRFLDPEAELADPKNPDFWLEPMECHGPIAIEPRSCFLSSSRDYFRMPDDVTGMVLTKSSYARAFNYCLTTVLQAGWEGHITLEFENKLPIPSVFYPGEGCAQIVFFRGNPCSEPYSPLRKYFGQQGVTTGRV